MIGVMSMMVYGSCLVLVRAAATITTTSAVTGSDKLQRARSRLYRSQILQVNMRLKALVEIYTMHSFAQLQNHIFFKKLVEFAKIFENFQKFCEFRNFSNRFFAKILRLQRCKRMHILQSLKNAVKRIVSCKISFQYSRERAFQTFAKFCKIKNIITSIL